MKTILILILTLIIINLASKTLHAQSIERIESEKETPGPRGMKMLLFENSKDYVHAQELSRAVDSHSYGRNSLPSPLDGGKKLKDLNARKSIQSPANKGHMNEAEYIFYRKLQRKKLA